MQRRVVFIAGLLGCLVGSVSLASAEITTYRVFSGNVDGYPFFRIPSIVRTNSGTLVAIAQGRAAEGDFTNADLVMKRSHDNGVTWDPVQLVVGNGDHVARNPVPIYDPVSGVITLLYCTNETSEHDLLNGVGSVRVWSMRSSDEGASWAAPVEITAQVKPSEWRHYALGPGHGIKLSTGRLLAVGNHSQAGDRLFRAHSVYSDDGGVTWQLGEVVDFPNANENQVAELADGTVLMIFRIQDRTQSSRGIVTSSDGGQTWNNNARVMPGIVDPVCQGSVLFYQGRLVLSNLDSEKEREKLTLSDGGLDGSGWRKRVVVQAGFAAYSDLVEQQDGQLGLLWEADTYRNINYSVIPSALLQPTGKPE
jgi:sialidase-1